MKYLLILLLSCSLHSQTIELTDQKLIKYYDLINKAENSFVSNNLQAANASFKEAFAINKEPQAKDIYNSMLISLSLKDYDNASKKYRELKCLGYTFDNFFLKKIFNHSNFKEKKCRIKFDLKYKNTLDSLFTIDQYYLMETTRNFKKR